MTGTQTLTIEIPSNEWLSANGRYHWAERSRRTRALRARAAWLARRRRRCRHRPLADRAHLRQPCPPVGP